MGVPADEVTLEAIAKANAAIDAANPGKAASTPAVKKVEEFKKYRRKQISELRPYEAGEDLAGVSVSDADKKAAEDSLLQNFGINRFDSCTQSEQSRGQVACRQEVLRRKSRTSFRSSCCIKVET